VSRSIAELALDLTRWIRIRRPAVDITARSCEITFKKGKRSLKGREANEVSATFAAAGVTPEGAAGSMIQTISKLSCTLDPGAIKENSGAGADCSLQTDQ
jgi:hypothetical protein